MGKLHTLRRAIERGVAHEDAILARGETIPYHPHWRFVESAFWGGREWQPRWMGKSYRHFIRKCRREYRKSRVGNADVGPESGAGR